MAENIAQLGPGFHAQNDHLFIDPQFDPPPAAVGAPPRWVPVPAQDPAIIGLPVAPLEDTQATRAAWCHAFGFDFIEGAQFALHIMHFQRHSALLDYCIENIGTAVAGQGMSPRDIADEMFTDYNNAIKAAQWAATATFFSIISDVLKVFDTANFFKIQTNICNFIDGLGNRVPDPFQMATLHGYEYEMLATLGPLVSAVRSAIRGRI
mgnify:CR=1 FL=1|tara:strand:+ start:4982 stop:5605 length:624 start_codon:yes stop_codon:yes gene_type:complete